MKNQRYHYILVFIVLTSLCFAPSAQAQTYVTTPMTGTYTNGEYYHNSQVIIGPDTYITPGSGQSVHIYIGCPPSGNSLTATQNYVLSTIPRVPGYNPSSAGYSVCDALQTIQYFDGLGRPLQTIQIKGSPSYHDVVQPFSYDAFGREDKKYLPYAAGTTADGSYKGNALTDIFGFYNPTGSGTSGQQQTTGIGAGVVINPNPYAQTNFEPSPLNRPVEQGAPGAAWQLGQHTTGVVYAINDNNAINVATGTGYPVRLYNVTIDGNGVRSLVDANTNYSANQLTVTITHDENYSGSGKNGTVEEYKDKEGHVVLKRTFNHNPVTTTTPPDETLSTYYVYDDMGQLAFVLPPGANPDGGLSSSANQTTLNNLCYQYNYDERNRLTQKKLPGKDWEYIVYNSLDQPVLSQDGNQRTNNQWAVTKYDGLGRVIMTGLWNAGSVIAQSTLQSSIYAAAQWDTRNYSDNTTGYSITSYPNTLSNILTVNYYDDYTNIPGMPTAYDQHSSYSSMTTGLPTASSTAILLADGTVSSSRLLNVHYYDDLGRNVKTFSQHYLGGIISNNNYDEVTNTYNFDNSVATTQRQHHTNAASGAVTLTTLNTYTYDHMGRKVQTDEQINGGTKVTISKLEYNEVGQLYKKHLHSTGGSAPLQNITYAYNERGWLSQINDPAVAPTASTLFSMKLGYNNPSSSGSTAQYNGNIAEQIYNKGTAGSQNVTYSYDNLNRITAGNSSESFSENSINYDLMGNFKSMQRYAAPNAGLLTYAYYSGTNQLSGVTSNTGVVTRSYGTYDANGNAPSDGSGHGITYNLLNLPISVSGLSLSYIYDATGKKLRKVSSTNTTDYIDGIQYTGTNLDFIQTEEGRVINPVSSPNYEYTLKDQLGNNRITFDQVNGKVGEDDYYPFGLNVHRQVNAGNKYLYNNKELQDELGQYDYGARFYDPVIGRMTTIDPHAEKYPGLSPFVYVGGNPMSFIDPTGKDLIRIPVPDGNGGTKYAVVDSKIAKQAYDFAWKMYNKYGAVVTESYRTDDQQRNVSGSGGLKAKVGKSRHQQGFALDFGVKTAYYEDKDSQKSESLTDYKTEVGRYGEDVSNFDWRYGLKDYPHFEQDARDYGYDSFQDAYNTNKKDYSNKGGVNGLPIYDPNKETDVTETVNVNGKNATVHATRLSDNEVQVIKDYLKTIQDQKKKDDKQ